MSNYVVITNYLAKDALASGNPLKVVKGADLTTEFNAIATMSGTKLDVNANGQITVTSTAAAAVAATFNGSANAYGTTINGSGTTGQSFGQQIRAGTNSSDYALLCQPQGGVYNYFGVRGDGAILGYGPTAAAQVDMTPDAGTFTLTGTGFSGSVTTSASWRRVGNLVFVYTTAISGTSNATTFGISGIPNAINPAQAQVSQVVNCQDNTAQVYASVQFNTNNTWTLFKISNGSAGFGNSSSSWTASGTKGLAAAVFCYELT